MKIKHRALALILTAMMVLTYMPALAFAEEKESADENAQPVAAEEVQEEAAPAEEPAPAKKAAPAVKSASEAKNANASGGYWESESFNSLVYQDEEGLAHLEVEVNHYDYESEDDWPVLKFCGMKRVTTNQLHKGSPFMEMALTLEELANTTVKLSSMG